MPRCAKCTCGPQRMVGAKRMKIMHFFPQTLEVSQKLGYSCARLCVAPPADIMNSRAVISEEVVDGYV